MTPEQISADDEAMRRLCSGDDDALGEIMDRWQNGVVRFLARLVGDADDALDLAQETFVRIYEHRSRYRPGSSFRAWLFTIAANLARNHNRWRTRHPAARLDQGDDEGIPDPPDTSPSPDSETASKELAVLVRGAVARLPEDLMVALILSEYEDMSHEEIARVVGCSRKAVEMRLYRARAEVRKRISPFT
jgi:RNA polymerase sigma-70 factor (ECF subfamily)